jgi:hypothetical protein
MRPTLVTNPVDDEDFTAFAEASVDAGASTADDLQSRLRERYARAVVHARELAGERILIWYVYRDGAWVSSGERARDEV